MRLSLTLFTWPKNLPNGNIWFGKRRIIRKVTPIVKNRLIKDIEREKKNMFYLAQPSMSKAEEQEIQNELHNGGYGLRPDQHWFQLRKKVIEGTTMGPVPLSQHFNSLRKSENWEV